jgi:hypothetical protein
MPFRQASKIAVREVCFWLYKGAERVLEGRIVVTKSPGVSTFGEYREIEIDGMPHTIGLFQGAIFEHELKDDGAASITLQYHVVKPDAESPIRHAQVRELRAGLTMGSESGMEAVESVALGTDYELAFRCHRVA